MTGSRERRYGAEQEGDTAIEGKRDRQEREREREKCGEEEDESVAEETLTPILEFRTHATTREKIHSSGISGKKVKWNEEHHPQ